MAQPLDLSGEIERGEAGEHRYRKVTPVRQGGGRRGADQGIARYAAGGGCRECQHQHAEQVESLAHAGGRAADRECEGPDEIEREQEDRGHHWRPGLRQC